MKDSENVPDSGINTRHHDYILSHPLRADEGLAYANTSLQLEYANSAFEQLHAKVTGVHIQELKSIASSPLFNSFSEGVKIIAQVLEGSTITWPLRTQGETKLDVTIQLEPAHGKGKVEGIYIRLIEAATAWHSNHLNFKALLESSSDAIVLLSPEGKPMYASPSVKEVLGYTQEEALKLDLHAAVHPDDLAENQKVMEKAIFNPGIPIRGHISRILHKDGTYHWYDSTVVNLLNDPAVGGVVDNLREVSAPLGHRSQTASTQAPDSLPEIADIGMWELDVASLVCKRNLQHDLLFGYTEALGQWTPETYFKHLLPEDKPELRKKFFQSVQEGLFNFEMRILWPDSTVHWVKMKGKALKGSDGCDKIAGTITEVTEIYEARKALKISEDRLKKILDNLPDGLVVADSKGDPLYWNPAALQLHDLSSMEEGRRQLPEFLKLFRLQSENGTALSFKDWPLPRLLRNEPVQSLKLNVSSIKNGWKKIFQYNGGTFPDVYGNDVYFLTISDVTSKPGKTRSIKQDEEKLWEAFHLSTMPMIISRKADGVCLDINKSAEDLLGYNYDEYHGIPALKLNFKSHRSHQAFLRKFNNNTGLYVEQETLIHTGSGSRRVRIFALENVLLSDEDCRLSILIDISG